MISWFAMTGGGSVSREYLEPSWLNAGTAGLPVSMLYFAEGEYDNIGPVAGSFRGLSYWTEVFTADGVEITATTVGETVTVTATTSADVDRLSVNGSDAERAENADGTLTFTFTS